MAYAGQALVLGPNINAPMNPDDEKKAFELAQKAVSSEGESHAARAGLHRRDRGALHGKGGRPQEGRPRVRGGDASDDEGVPGRCGRQDDLRRIADGPAAVELLDARRRAVRRDARDPERAEGGAREEPESPRRAALLGARLGADRHARARRGGGRPAAAGDARRRPHGPHARAHLPCASAATPTS